MLRDFRADGPQLWQRFTVKDPGDHLWYYGKLLGAYRSRGAQSWMADELSRVLNELTDLVTAREPAVVV